MDISIDILLQQTINDLLVECNLIGKNMVDKANQQLMAEIMTPDDPETKSIICRAHSEAIGDVKKACRRYMKTGRISDSNVLERLHSSTNTHTVNVQVVVDNVYKDLYKYQDIQVYKVSSNNYKAVSDGNTVSGATDSNVEQVTKTVVDSVEYAVVPLEMDIPNWDIAVTDALKNHIHKYIVDYVMWRFLQNQADEKCAEYKKLADEEDYPNIEHDLTCRDRFTRRQAQFY